jgi:cytochrome o ubiquinol oxidase subunit 2
LMLIVVIPVIVMSLVFVIHYRKGNAKDEYLPNWHHSVFLEILWWGIPIAIVTLIAIITWYATHQLDPYRKINYPGKMLQVKVIALPWKWLFIYEDNNQQITTVNHLVIPEEKQISFLLTSDNVPMSSFFIPQLGSQIYVMAGMQTKLHLVADQTTTIEGFNAQFNGFGFHNMRFKVDVVNKTDFAKWLATSKKQPAFTEKEYLKLREPSPYKFPPTVYQGTVSGLFEKIKHVYMLDKHPTAKRIVK